MQNKFRWILTAAHCLGDRKRMHVGLGAQAPGMYDTFFEIDAMNQHIHPEYDLYLVINDIGMMIDK